MLRDLKLTTPYMHGADVTRLQKALNVQLGREHHRKVKADGQYGPASRHAVAAVAWRLGLVHRDGRPAVQRLIESPGKRTQKELARAKKREAEIAKQGHGLAGVLAHALTHVGVSENPAGSNWGTPYPAEWEENFGFHTGVSWCGCFAGSMILSAGGHVDSRVAYVPYIVQDAKAKTNGFKDFVAWDGDRTAVKPGWLVMYDWNGAHSFGEHVGVVKEITAGGVVACEGNTSGTNASDGGMVAVMVRSSEFVIGYAEPSFTA